MNGTDLVANFRASRSEAAFSDLVRRYTNLVYSIAKRRVSNASVAQEVTQLVFIRLAKAAPKIRGDAELVAWLHRTTVHASIDLWRSEIRRRAREEHVAAMQPSYSETAPWNEMTPVLDEALNELNEADRQTILLRFFDEKSMRDLGASFGVSEDAAKMRVSRALDRLRERLSSRRVTCGSVALGALLAEHSVEAAPSQVVAALAACKFPLSAGLGAAGIFGLLLNVSKVKLAAGAAAILIIGAAAVLLLAPRDGAKLGGKRGAAQSALADAMSPQTEPDFLQTDTNGTAETGREPDPLKLLQGVAQARQRITSGSIEFRVSSHHGVRGRRETNEIRITALFDGQKLRFESVGREYSYTLMGDGASEFSDAKMVELGLDREGAVKAGILKGFESHHVLAYDGAILMDYWENDGKPAGTTIRDPREGSGSFIFDPRCLGLTMSPGAGDTVENCLGYNGAKSIELLGEEVVEGLATWHIRLRSKYDDVREFWIDVAHKERMIKHAYGRNEVVCRYLRKAPDLPLPVVVTTLYRREGNASWGHQFTLVNSRFYDVAIDATSFTLAGLGMKVGTDVSDRRNSRRIGYWTGTGLSENLPSKKAPDAEPAPTLAEMIARLQADPASPSGFEAASWILLNTPDGPEVEKAADVIQREHIQGTNLVSLCHELERVRHRSSKTLLQAMLDNNPNPDVQATACFMLGSLFKDEAKYGENKKALAEAEKLFERVVTQFSHVGREGPKLAPRAKADLFELQRLTIGKRAPELAGRDLDGNTIRLSDYRGKVVVLVFWGACGGCRPDVDELHKLLDRVPSESIAVLGVHCDDDAAKARQIAEKVQMTWPSFLDGRDGPIGKAWNVHGWPTVFILDRQGVIRYRGVYQSTLQKAVDTLLAE